jgi:hypothetical protein
VGRPAARFDMRDPAHEPIFRSGLDSKSDFELEQFQKKYGVVEND